MNIKKTILTIAVLSSFYAFSNDFRDLPHNTSECSPSELEVYIAKKNAGLMIDTPIRNWEETKAMVSAAKTNPVVKAQINATGDPAADAAMKKKAAEAATSDSQCDLMNSEYESMDLSALDQISEALSNIGSGGGLVDMMLEASKAKLNEVFEAAKQGMCASARPEKYIEQTQKTGDKIMKKNLGYSSSDMSDPNILNDVTNDVLKEQTGESQGKLLNVFDSSLDDNRQRYIERTIKKKQKEGGNTLEDIAEDKIDEML